MFRPSPCRRRLLHSFPMGVQPDHWIEKMAREAGMIEPFESSLLSKGLISFGVSSYGYDFRLADFYKLPPSGPGTLLDPKNLPAESFTDYRGDSCVIPPHSFVLGHSLEYFRIPRNILTICTGKSTYARCGVVVNVTPFEPEWEGHATISICNTASSPVKIYSGEGIAQLVFLSADQMCQTSYGDRKGKYQAQKGIVLSRIQEDDHAEAQRRRRGDRGRGSRRGAEAQRKGSREGDQAEAQRRRGES